MTPRARGTESTSREWVESSGKTAPYLAAALLAGGAVVLAWRLVGFEQPPFGLDTQIVQQAIGVFSAVQQRAAAAYQSHIVWPITLSLAASTAMAVLLGFTRLGTRLVAGCGRFLRRPVLTALGVVVCLVLLGALASLPFDLWAYFVRKDAGLVVASLGVWLSDRAIALGVTLLIGVIVVAVVLACVRVARQRWWLPASALAGLAVIVGAWLTPIVIEPLFARTTPLADTTYAEQLVEIQRLARIDNFDVQQMLVSDASSKSTMLNAYVSGFGGRIVLFDTLLAKGDAKTVRMVVAHELAHAKYQDVLVGAVIGGLGLAAFVALLGAWFPQVSAAQLPRIFAIVAIAMVLAMPATNYVSRSMEWRADEHALALTNDPQTFIEMQKQLAVSNRSALDPPAWRYWVFFTHPTSPQRIALGQAWLQTRSSARSQPPSPSR